MAVLVALTIVGSSTGPYLALDIAVGIVSLALVPLLTRWPVPAALALSLLAALSPAATPSATMAALLIACWRRLEVAAAVAGTGIAAHLIQGSWRPIAGLTYGWYAVLVCVAYAALAGWGTLVRAHQALIFSLRDRAERAEADQARRVAEARAAERARIAREMHDVLAHRLSLLATYAGAISYRPDASPEQVSRAAEVVRTGAHQALDELREVIGVLRDDSLPDLAAGLRPLPGLTDLPELVREAQAAGTPVEAGGPAWPATALPETDGPGLREAAGPELPEAAGWAVPEPAGRTVYRVVQEGLTNARKHAPGQPVRVTLGGAPGAGLDVSVVNLVGAAPASSDTGADADMSTGLSTGTSTGLSTGASTGPIPGSGTGLIGLAERLELAGGRLEYRADEREFRLRAWLPWPRADAADAADTTGAGVAEAR
jgi:signal transduction histidine kinase